MCALPHAASPSQAAAQQNATTSRHASVSVLSTSEAAAAHALGVSIPSVPESVDDGAVGRRNDTRLTTKGSGKPPVVIFASWPCAGSTAVQQVARDMVAEHGHVVAPLSFETLKKDKNVCFAEHSKTKSREQAAVAATHRMLTDVRDVLGMAIVLKLGAPGTYFGRQAQQQLIAATGGRIVISYRANALDSLTCHVRDCFDRKSGRVVFPNGTRAAACFNRRKLHIHTEAELWIRTLRAKLAEHSKQAKQVRGWLWRDGWRNIHEFSSEQLLAFEQGPEYAEKSVNAWHAFLSRGTSVSADQAAVRRVIQRRVAQHGYRPLKPHNQTIHNIAAVTAALDGSPYSHFVRL